MLTSEIFRSLQGEGLLSGTESIFVRFGGCNLRCRFCDTRYSSWSPEGDELSLAEVLARVADLDRLPAESVPVSWSPAIRPDEKNCPAAIVRHVVVTGGEPMLFADVVPLCAALRDRGRHVTIETAGTIYAPVACDLMSISPKLTNSTPTPRESPRWARQHEAARHRRRSWAACWTSMIIS